MIPLWFALFIAFVTYMVGAWQAQTRTKKTILEILTRAETIVQARFMIELEKDE